MFAATECRRGARSEAPYRLVFVFSEHREIEKEGMSPVIQGEQFEIRDNMPVERLNNRQERFLSQTVVSRACRWTKQWPRGPGANVHALHKTITIHAGTGIRPTRYVALSR